MEQSQHLEATLKSYGPDRRVLSGRAASIIAELEDHIAMKGKPTKRIVRLITELSEEGLL